MSKTVEFHVLFLPTLKRIKVWPDDGIDSRVSSRNSEVRTDNWELNQIANISGGGSPVVDESLNDGENQEFGEDSAERESQRLAERENEENEVKQKLF